jgi:hypothetical protein
MKHEATYLSINLAAATTQLFLFVPRNKYPTGRCTMALELEDHHAIKG